jgi:branched-chain amino acid transport system substrate-binding protein
MLGPYSSGLTKAIAPVTEKYAIPMIEGNGASRSLFNKGYRYLFAVLSTSDFYLREAVNLAAEVAQLARKDPRTVKVALAIENDPFSQDIRAGVLEDAKRWKMKVVIDDKLPPELNDMSATLTKVKVLRPDLLVISGHSKGATLAIKQVSQKKINVPMLAITHCEAAKVIKNFGPLADYTLCAAQWAPPLTYKDKWFGPASDYAKRFENTASVLVYADALARAGSFDTEKVRDAIAATSIETFYGNVKFDATGKNVAKPMVLRQIQKGEYKVVAPTRWAKSKLIHPRPKWSKR